MLKNKDGTPYKLKHPNKLAVTQDIWIGSEEFILHNMEWQKELIEDTRIVPKKSDSSNPTKKSPEIDHQNFDATSYPTKEINTNQVEHKEEIKEEKHKFESIVERETDEEYQIAEKTHVDDDYIIVFHAQPAIIREREDDLYGDSYKTIQYGKKFIFEGVITHETDMVLMMWTTKKINEGSVIFPTAYKSGKKYKTYRWWKINSSQKKEDGFLHTCIPSTYQPDFS